MIFHCSADAVYVNKYFPLYYSSIRRYCDTAEFSLNIVSREFLDLTNYDIRFLTREKSSLEEIKEKYPVINDRDALGYYAFNRWISLPPADKPLVVSDIDLAAINPIDKIFVYDLLKKYDVIQVTRITRDDSGGVVMFILNPQIVDSVRSFARKHLETSALTWDLDLGMLRHFRDNYQLIQTLNLRDVTKNGELTDEKSWFIYSKGKERKHTLLNNAWLNSRSNNAN